MRLTRFGTAPTPTATAPTEPNSHRDACMQAVARGASTAPLFPSGPHCGRAYCPDLERSGTPSHRPEFPCRPRASEVSRVAARLKDGTPTQPGRFSHATTGACELEIAPLRARTETSPLPIATRQRSCLPADQGPPRLFAQRRGPGGPSAARTAARGQAETDSVLIRASNLIVNGLRDDAAVANDERVCSKTGASAVDGSCAPAQQRELVLHANKVIIIMGIGQILAQYARRRPDPIFSAVLAVLAEHDELVRIVPLQVAFQVVAGAPFEMISKDFFGRPQWTNLATTSR